MDSFVASGAFCQDPAGWSQRYFRPNPNSTAGYFFAVIFSGGYQGSLMPYVPTVKMRVRLRDNSTQSTAYAAFNASTVAITDKKMFLLSLRKVLGIKGKIDPMLFATGPVALEEEE